MSDEETIPYPLSEEDMEEEELDKGDTPPPPPPPTNTTQPAGSSRERRRKKKVPPGRWVAVEVVAREEVGAGGAEETEAQEGAVES